MTKKYKIRMTYTDTEITRVEAPTLEKAITLAKEKINYWLENGYELVGVELDED